MSNDTVKKGFNTCQEAFDFVVTHMRNQGHRAVTDGSGAASAVCLYGIEGDDTFGRCAVGACLTTLPYVNGGPFNGDVVELIDRFPEMEEDLEIRDMRRTDHLSFWSDMQLAHDEEMNWLPGGGFSDRMHQVLEEVALSYGLTYSR